MSCHFKGVSELSNAEWFSQLPFIFLVSVAGGLLGTLFNWMHERLFPVSLLAFWLSQSSSPPICSQEAGDIFIRHLFRLFVM